MKQPSFECFYEEYFERIYTFVFYRVGGQREQARDLTQDIFIKAFEAFDRYDPALSRSAWLYTIARNHVINTYAKTRPQVALEEIEDCLSASHDPRAAYLLRQDEVVLYKALRELPPEEARLIQLKYLEGWSFAELSEILQKNSGALRVQAGRVLKKMRGFLSTPSL
ncbi:sigma-70 family RNA polymerase sigma factor [Patescibacteria group bacterium]|nr:sigma-70 family RNA polymerase sigma factor [Patescibacteria group bacterium]